MNGNFFDYICIPVGEADNYESNTSLAVPLKNCQCDGNQFFGMPDIDFSLNVDQYQTKFYYDLEPNEYEMTPKIDKELRTAKCALGLWNLVDRDGESSDEVKD